MHSRFLLVVLLASVFGCVSEPSVETRARRFCTESEEPDTVLECYRTDNVRFRVVIQRVSDSLLVSADSARVRVVRANWLTAIARECGAFPDSSVRADHQALQTGECYAQKNRVAYARLVMPDSAWHE